MLRGWIDRAEHGESLWLPLLRKEFARYPGSEKMIVRLMGGNYGVREYTIMIPPISGLPEDKQSEKEWDFLIRYLTATVYNLLSAFSAEEVVLFCGEGKEQAFLANALRRLMEEDPGLRKAQRIARRIYGTFRFRVLSMNDYAEEPCCFGITALGASMREGKNLSSLLKKRAEAAEGKNCLGLDIGGSDIKVALSRRGKLLYTKEIDWNPAAYPTAEEIVNPILALVREACSRFHDEGESLDSVGISFPDVVIGDRIVGGETPKTMGMRNNPKIEYEAEFLKLGGLRDAILAFLPPGASVRIANDGNIAAFTAAMELAVADAPPQTDGDGQFTAALDEGVLAFTLGTDLGTGWLRQDGTIPAMPLEMYDLLLDLGDLPSRALPPLDLRSTRNENSGMAGVRRYLGQAAAYRLAWKLDPDLLCGFVQKENDLLVIPTTPEDLRKPCLAHLMEKAEEGDPAAEEVFRRIGSHLAMVVCEMDWIFGAIPPVCFLFGRFAKSQSCFELLQEGFKTAGSMLSVRLLAADENLANTPLMRELAMSKTATVAQLGQAIGAIYYALG